jgi:protein-tyrosine phosphatase
MPGGEPAEFGLYLLGSRPPPLGWESRWVRWPDYRLPRDRVDAADALHELWRRAETMRVEVACAGGRGRTGTALACLAVIDGLAPRDAVDYVRKGYHPGAVQTPWQRRYVARFRR